MAIPQNLATAIERAPGQVFRQREKIALIELANLEILPDSQIGEFYLTYNATNLYSDHAGEELNELCSPSPQLLEATVFVREMWELPSEFVCLTSAEGEGAYLYSLVDGQVYDFDLADRDSFLEERPAPLARDFFAFLEWYLSPSE